MVLKNKKSQWRLRSDAVETVLESKLLKQTGNTLFLTIDPKRPLKPLVWDRVNHIFDKVFVMGDVV